MSAVLSQSGAIAVSRARTEQMPEISRLIGRSYEQLCGRDHQEKPMVLQAFKDSTQPQFLEPFLKLPNADIVVVQRNSQVIGVLSFVCDYPKPGEATIGHCYVDPTCTKQGIGTSMLKEMERQLERKGDIVLIRVHSSTLGQSFYERHGYKAIGRASVPSVNPNITLDAVVMEKNFDDTKFTWRSFFASREHLIANCFCKDCFVQHKIYPAMIKKLQAVRLVVFWYSLFYREQTKELGNEYSTCL